MKDERRYFNGKPCISKTKSVGGSLAIFVSLCPSCCRRSRSLLSLALRFGTAFLLTFFSQPPSNWERKWASILQQHTSRIAITSLVRIPLLGDPILHILSMLDPGNKEIWVRSFVEDQLVAPVLIYSWIISHIREVENSTITTNKRSLQNRTGGSLKLHAPKARWPAQNTELAYCLRSEV